MDTEVEGFYSLCPELLINNTGMPADYPVTLEETADAVSQFEAKKNELLSTFGVSETEYELTPLPFTLSGDLDRSMTSQWVYLTEGPIDETNAESVTKEFLETWSTLFNYDGRWLTTGLVSCSSTTEMCQVRLWQNYCDIPLETDEIEYDGRISVLTESAHSGIHHIVSRAVPLIPVPGNPVITEQDAANSVIGEVLTYACATGERSYEITQDTFVDFPATPSIFVGIEEGIENALVYRLTIPVDIYTWVPTDPNHPNYPDWTLYVDAFEGTVVGHQQHFICD